MDNQTFFESLGGIVPTLERWLRQTICDEVSKALEADRARQHPEKLYTRDEVCSMLSISKPTLWARTKSGEIPCKRVGRRVLYTESAVRKVLGGR